MGVLWYDNSKTRALASFEDGIVYKGDGIFRKQIGSYTSYGVLDSFGATVAKFDGNTAYNPLRFSIEAYCTFDYGTIYNGGSRWNDMLAVYDGDPYGACAAAVLYFGLHINKEQDNKYVQQVSPTNSRTETPYNSAYTTGSLGGELIGVIVTILVLFVAAYAFYFTEWGHKMVFEEETGRQVFFICLACAVVSSIAIYFSKSINGFFDIAGCVLGSNIITYIIVLIIAFSEAKNEGFLNFGYAIMLILGGVIGTVGVASLFCIIEIPAVYIAKLIKNRIKK